MLEHRYFKTSSRMPAYDYIKDQTAESRLRIITEMGRLDKSGLRFAMRDQTVKKLLHSYPLYELRVKVGKLKHRLLFTIRGSVCWYVSGFLKQSGKTPKNEIETARSRAEQIK